ncbi:MarR family winged helix-turn-helix transcriptional regulator [Bacillus sp. USDA818B3_A]|uniref:MarR family winged helix-turn-helix transcriptional regulator n=1 Tax=Bacillus sp. USDA818B3_A TaxID=2698834 RepID=UPI00136C2F68|nr:MarR family transcriptional regulator [Bacillus sp. USDA818B3_A]
MTIDLLNNEILMSFFQINKAYNRLVKSDAERLGITPVQLKALYRINFNPNISLGELAEKLKLTNSTVSGVIDRLVHSGLVERVAAPGDRRSVSIRLTEEGRKRLDQFNSSDSILMKKIKEVLDLPEEEISHLLRLHQLVLDKLTI